MTDQQPPKDPLVIFRGDLERARPQLMSVLPSHLKVDRFVSTVLSTLSRNPSLFSCTRHSLFNACVQAAELGLEVGGALGEAYIVAFKQTATLIPGYRGFIALGRRSGQIQDVEAHLVHKNDHFFVRFGTEPVLEHTPNMMDPGEIVGVYATGRIVGNAHLHVEVMRKLEVDAVRATSRSKDSGPWVQHYGEMARKTVVRRMFKYLPMSVELAKAMELDDQDYEHAKPEPRKQLPTLRERAYEATVSPTGGEVEGLGAGESGGVIEDPAAAGDGLTR